MLLEQLQNIELRFSKLPVGMDQTKKDAAFLIAELKRMRKVHGYDAQATDPGVPAPAEVEILEKKRGKKA